MKNWKLLSVITVGAFLAMGALYNLFTPRAVHDALASEYSRHTQLQSKRDLDKQVGKLEIKQSRTPAEEYELKVLREELDMVKCQLYPKTCKGN